MSLLFSLTTFQIMTFGVLHTYQFQSITPKMEVLSAVLVLSEGLLMVSHVSDNM